MNSRAAASEFDFIVVGAGTAGCLIAARLSKDDGARVLLLEAGGREPLEAVPVPPAWPSLEGTSADWADTTVALTASGTTMRWARGRGLGGSSAINGMIFTRGHRSSYDAWPVPAPRVGDLTICWRICGAASTRRDAIRRTVTSLARWT